MGLSPSERTKRWQAKNPAKVRAIAKANYARHRKRYSEERKAAYAAAAEERRAAARLKYATEPARRELVARHSRARYVAKTEDLKAYQRRYRAEHPDRVAALANQARARKAAAPGRTTAEEWAATLEYFGGFCGYCLKHESEVGPLAREHMDPLTRGGTNWPENLVPGCKSCNSRKSASNVVEFTLRLRAA